MNGSIAGIFRAASGGVVGGASNLTTPGSIVYVASAGVLGQDTSYSRSAAGRYTLYDSTPTTGVTTLTVRAGAGQSSTNLQEWNGSDGVTLTALTSTGGILFNNPAGANRGQITSGSTTTAQFYNFVTFNNNLALRDGVAIQLASNMPIAWSSTASSNGTPDLGLSRASAGLLKVTDGSTGFGGIAIASQTPASAAATGTQGTIAWDADYIYVCTATDTWKRVAIATW